MGWKKVKNRLREFYEDEGGQYASAMRRQLKGKGMLGEKPPGRPRKHVKETRGKVFREVFEELAKNKTLYEIHEKTGYPMKTICKLNKEFREDEGWWRLWYPKSGDPKTKHWKDYEKHPEKAKVVRKITPKTPKKKKKKLGLKEEQRLLKKAWEEGKTMRAIMEEEK